MPTTTSTPSIEPAPDQLNDDRGVLSRTFVYYAAFVALGMTAASLGPTLPGLAKNTQTVLSEISFIFTARSLGYLMGSFLAGQVYDRVPGHPVMGSALVIMSLMLILTPVMPLLWLLTAVLLILGLAEGLLDVGGNTLLVWLHGENVGPFMNALHFFFGLGAFISPIIIAQAVLISGDITWAYWVLAVLMLPVLAWILRIPSTATADSASPTHFGQADRNRNTSRQYLLVMLMAVFFFLYVGAEIGYGGWVFTYAVEAGLADETTAAYLTSMFFGALTIGRLLAIPIAVRVRPRFILLSDLSGCLASVGVVLLWPGSLTALWVGTFGLGFSMASIFPTLLALAERRLIITGNITSWFFVGASSGGMFWPWLVGQLFESRGPSVLMTIVMVVLLLATALYAVLILYSARLMEKPNP